MPRAGTTLLDVRRRLQVDQRLSTVAVQHMVQPRELSTGTLYGRARLTLRPSPRSETTIHRRCPSVPLRPLQVSTATRIVDIRFAAGPDGAVNDQVGAPRCFQTCLKQEHTQALAHLSLLLRQFLVLGTHLAVRNRHHPPQWQYIFALTMDVDGFPGGALWRSDKHGAYDSWADQTQKLAASLPQVRPWREAACRAGRRAATQGLGRPGSLWRGREPQAVLGALQSIAAEPCCKAAAADPTGTPAGQHEHDGRDGHRLAREEA